jgi:hypothetical protein
LSDSTAVFRLLGRDVGARTAYPSQVAAEGRHPHLPTAMTTAAHSSDDDPDAPFERVPRGTLSGLIR